MNLPKTLRGLALGVGLCIFGLGAVSVQAFNLAKSSRCTPGASWDTSNPIQVRLHEDSFVSYLNLRGGTNDRTTDFERIETDIRSVVDLYNAMPGMRYRLEYNPNRITGDANLDPEDEDNFGAQTIVIGFNRAGSGAPEAAAHRAYWTGRACVIERVNIPFRMMASASDPYHWVFGPPDRSDGNGRHFTTVEQPPIARTAAITFLGILTHEMGHAMGIDHPDSEYAIMDQGFSTWFRGPGHRLRTGLLPDDIAGLRALYGSGSAGDYYDISVSNTWFQSRDQRDHTCDDEREAQATAEQILDVAVSGGHASPEAIAQFVADVTAATNTTMKCEADLNAIQETTCTPSSRSDGWADRTDGNSAPCAVSEPGSSYPPVSDSICPGDQVQLRYTINNHAPERHVAAELEMWLSQDRQLIPNRGPDRRLRSPDVRKVFLQPGESENLGQVFRIPDTAVAGSGYYVFMRAVPIDTVVEEPIWNQDLHPWNNVAMLYGTITVRSNGCGS